MNTNKNYQPRRGPSTLFVGGFDLLSAIIGTTPTVAHQTPAVIAAEAASPGLPDATDELDITGGQSAQFPDTRGEPSLPAVDSPSVPRPESAASESNVAEVVRDEAPAIADYELSTSTARQAPPWPQLDVERLVALHCGDVARYDANIAALKLLRVVEAAQRAPTEDERLTLAAYSGWGGLKEVFETRCHPSWAGRKAELEQLLTEHEWNSARDSVVNAFFTDARIAQAIWACVRHLGFTRGRILEPSAGAGIFLGTMPADIAMASDAHAVELDEMSGRLLRVLYGTEAKVRITGFETCGYVDDWFDLVIGNVPFGKYKVACMRNRLYSNQSVHNYFMGRALDVVRPGGVVAFITSTSFLDSRQGGFREYVGQRARLLGALRLPTGAFADSAGTSVSSDIVFLQKRFPTEAVTDDELLWTELAQLPQSSLTQAVAQSDAFKSSYWSSNPGMVIGNWALRSQQYGQSLVVEFAGNDLAAEVESRRSMLPADAMQPGDTRLSAVQVPAAEDLQAWRSGQLVERNATIMSWQQGQWTPSGLTGKARDRALGMIRIRDLVRHILDRQVYEEASDSELDQLRQELNVVYDAFVRWHGPINLKANTRVFRTDPDFPLLLSLEVFDSNTQTAEKAAIFKQRTGGPTAAPVRADNAIDAVTISVAETGEVNPSYIGQLLGTAPEAAMQELLEESLIFIDPSTMRYETAAAYLSGNVREKLELAQLAGAEFERNAVALTAALPPDLEPGDIDARLGSPWIPPADYEAFFRSLFGKDMQSWNTVQVRRDNVSGAWSLSTNLTYGVALTQTWGTDERSATELLNTALNGQLATVRDTIVVDGRDVSVVNVPKTAAARDKQNKLETHFSNWLWADTERSKRLARLYNDQFNNYVDRIYDGSKLRLPGYSFSLIPDTNQRNTVARIATGSNTLLAQVVGAGKSLEMIIGSMELKRLGLAKKPLHTIPNNMLLQYTAEFVRAYPGARVLMASKEDLGKGPTRKLFCARVATGDWDAIIMTHSAFERIAPDPAMAERFIEDTLSSIRSALESVKSSREQRSLVKALVRAEKDWQARLERLQGRWKKDDFITLKQMGVDRLFIDELHLFKNLFRFSQMQRVAGLPNSNAQRSTDLLIKTREIMAAFGGRECGIVGATGTPVSNTMAELHVMQRYLQPRSLERAGIAQFDAWAANFGRIVTGLEVSPDGSSFRMNSRFAQFVNLPELMGLFRQVADIKTKEMLNLPTPALVGGGPQTCLVKPSEDLKAYVQALVKRADAIKNRQVKPDQDNMLAVTNDGRKAALDLRLVRPLFGFDPTGKLAACAAKVFDIWERTARFRGTQIVFCDLGTPTSHRFSVYLDLKNQLTKLGIPASEIAFIHDANNDAAKEALFAQVRQGTIRVLLASTAKAGVGTNVQTRLYALHHLDVPWRPADIEQRNGRAERRGNTCEEIEIWLYVTEGSFDAYSWQLVSAKARFIAQVMCGDRSIRKIDDVGMQVLSYEEVKAIACGNPVVREKAQLDAEMRRLELVRSAYVSSRWSARNELAGLPARRESAQQYMQGLREDILKSEQVGDALEVEGQVFTEPSEIQELLHGISQHERTLIHRGLQARSVARYAGLPLVIEPSRLVDKLDFKVRLLGHSSSEIYPYLDGRRFHAELAAAVANLHQDMETAGARLRYLERQEPLLQAQASAEFEHEQKLLELRRRSMDLEVELGLTSGAAGTEAMDAKSNFENHSTITAEDAVGLADEASDGDPEEEVEELV